MAGKAGRLYGLEIDEAMRLNPQQVQFMEGYAQKVAEDMFDKSPELQAELAQRLAPVTRQVRAELAGGGGGAVGPPPSSGKQGGAQAGRFWDD